MAAAVPHADGYLCTLIYTDAQWRRFWSAVGQPEMMNDPRFMDMAARSRNIADVYRIAEAQFAAKTTQQWLAQFDELEIPAGPLNSLDDVLNDEHLAPIGFFRHFKHPTEGELVMPDVPVRFTDSPAGDRPAAAAARRAWPRGAGGVRHEAGRDRCAGCERAAWSFPA